MNIVVSANSKYVRYLYVMLLSLFEQNSDSSITVFVLQRDFTADDRNTLQELVKNGKGDISFLFIDEKRFKGFPVSDKFPLEAYFRLIMAELLPPEVEKALYLDVDIIVRGSLKELYDTDIENKAAAVCLDMYRPVLDDKKKVLFRRTEENREYFNSGVMLFNIKKMRKEYTFDTFVKAAEDLGFDLQYADQEILNYLLFDKVLYLPGEKYNYLVMGDVKEEELSDGKPLILHFAGCNPWQDGLKNDLYRIWWRYAKRSPFYTELLEEQLWRAEGLDSDGNAVGMREMEIKGIYEVAFSLKGRGCIRKWLEKNGRKICIYGAGAMAEVLYELLLSDNALEYLSCVYDKTKSGSFHGVMIDNAIKDAGGSVMVITPAYKPHEIMRYVKDETGWTGEAFLLREFLYKVS